MKAFFLLGMVVAVSLIGCTSKVHVAPGPTLNKDLKLPQGWLNPPVENPKAREGYLFGTGSYSVRIDDADPNFAKTMADNRARQELQQTLSQQVASSINDYYARKGHTQNVAEEAAKASAVSVGNFDMSGAEVYRREFISGVLYSFIRFPVSADKRKELMNAVRESLGNTEAEQNSRMAEEEWQSLESRAWESINKKMGQIQ